MLGIILCDIHGDVDVLTVWDTRYSGVGVKAALTIKQLLEPDIVEVVQDNPPFHTTNFGRRRRHDLRGVERQRLGFSRRETCTGSFTRYVQVPCL